MGVSRHCVGIRKGIQTDGWLFVGDNLVDAVHQAKVATKVLFGEDLDSVSGEDIVKAFEHDHRRFSAWDQEKVMHTGIDQLATLVKATKSRCKDLQVRIVLWTNNSIFFSRSSKTDQGRWNVSQQCKGDRSKTKTGACWFDWWLGVLTSCRQVILSCSPRQTLIVHYTIAYHLLGSSIIKSKNRFDIIPSSTYPTFYLY